MVRVKSARSSKFSGALALQTTISGKAPWTYQKWKPLSQSGASMAMKTLWSFAPTLKDSQKPSTSWLRWCSSSHLSVSLSKVPWPIHSSRSSITTRINSITHHQQWRVKTWKCRKSTKMAKIKVVSEVKIIRANHTSQFERKYTDILCRINVQTNL